MSGFEVAGVLLGTFPLIISGLEHWRNVAKFNRLFWRIRQEHTKCLNDMRYHEILYKRNLKELLLPIVNDEEEVARLIGNPGGKDWSSKALKTRLEARLQESYGLYMEAIHRMNETAEELKKELCLDNTIVQNKLEPKEDQISSSPQLPNSLSKFTPAKSKWKYERFRLGFSFKDPVRNELLKDLDEYNGRLEKLLRKSDMISALENATSFNPKQTSALEAVFKKAWKKSDLLFKALEKSWQCSCQQYHFANLRLEHRKLREIRFEVILMFIAPSPQVNTPWSWEEIQCGQTVGCPFPHKFMEPSTAPQSSPCPSDDPPVPALPPISRTTPIVQNIEIDVAVDPCIKLCQLLGNEERGKCMGIIGQDDGTYHLYPSTNKNRPNNSSTLTLDQMLSSNFKEKPTRRQRCSIALLLASSVAQLRSTPWLRTGLTKEDVLFFPCDENDGNIPYQEIFIRQGFLPDNPSAFDTDANDFNFFSLGILLLELCFGIRIEDHPLRKGDQVRAGKEKQAFDVMAALEWSQSVHGEAGEDYAWAVKWCFTGGKFADQSWRGDIIKNVIRPLETCQEHFERTIGP